MKLASSIDRMVEKKALSSFHVTSSNFSTNNVYDLANKLIDLSQRKIVLINLKVLVENALKNCPRDEAKLLIAKYIVRKKSADICKMFNLPLRTYFRKVSEAECRFEKELHRLGYSASKLQEFLKDETWIMDTKEKFEHSKEETQIELCCNQISKKSYVLV